MTDQRGALPCGCPRTFCDYCGEEIVHPDGVCRACLVDSQVTDRSDFDWVAWALGLAQVSSTTRHARKAIEAAVAGYFETLAERDRLTEGLKARGVLTGRNPDGVNDDVEKALLLIDELCGVLRDICRYCVEPDVSAGEIQAFVRVRTRSLALDETEAGRG